MRGIDRPSQMEWMGRREFLNTSLTAMMACLVGSEPRQLAAATKEKIQSTADTIILLWMAGGMAQTETFDPKKVHTVQAGN